MTDVSTYRADFPPITRADVEETTPPPTSGRGKGRIGLAREFIALLVEIDPQPDVWLRYRHPVKSRSIITEHAKRAARDAGVEIKIEKEPRRGDRQAAMWLKGRKLAVPVPDQTASGPTGNGAALGHG